MTAKPKRLGAGIYESPVARRAAGALPSLPATVVRRAEDRARLRTELPVAVGEQVRVELVWVTRSGDPESIVMCVEVYAVHPGGFVDVKNWTPYDTSTPNAVRVRRPR